MSYRKIGYMQTRLAVFVAHLVEPLKFYKNALKYYHNIENYLNVHSSVMKTCIAVSHLVNMTTFTKHPNPTNLFINIITVSET